MIRAALLAALLSCAAPAAALFDATEMETIDVSARLEPEYFQHTLAFSYPFVWDDAWSASTAPAYRVNGASLGCCELLLQQEVRFHRELPYGMSFRFRLLQDDDREHQYFHYLLELEKKLAGGLSASIFGEPTYHKEDSDVGFGLAYEPVPGLRASARHTFVDFNFNQRGHTTQRYETYPATDELGLSAKPSEDLKVAAAFMFDWPTRRLVPDDNRTFSYRRTRAELSVLHAPPGRWSRRLSYLYEYEHKGDLFVPVGANQTNVTTKWTEHRLQTALEGAWGGQDRLELGHRLILRPARTDFTDTANPGIKFGRWESEPYLRWRHDLKPWLVSELAGIFSLGEDRQVRTTPAAASLYRTVAEAAMGFGLDFVFGPSGRIGIYGALDLDELAPHPWDGGNIRAMFLF
ncbi:MAG: hypothetical protein PHU21_13775 [Elusimicrobia bacterium]|nr:hypothetical protein [Elusimicrobiota bacterium]